MKMRSTAAQLSTRRGILCPPTTNGRETLPSRNRLGDPEKNETALSDALVRSEDSYGPIIWLTAARLVALVNQKTI